MSTQGENVRLTDKIIRTRQAEERRHFTAAIRETVCR